MSDYGYQEQNDPIEEQDERYHAKTRNETRKNIKLLNEILAVQNSNQQRAPEPQEPPKKKRSNKSFPFTIESLRTPLLMIVLYIALHTPQVHYLMIRYLPKQVTNPDNMIVYYGVRGFIFAFLFYTIRYYLF